MTLLQSGISIPSSTTFVAHNILQFLSSRNKAMFSFKFFSEKFEKLFDALIPRTYVDLIFFSKIFGSFLFEKIAFNFLLNCSQIIL